MPHDLASCMDWIDRLGGLHWAFSVTMLWQSALVIGGISLLDWSLLRRSRASVRYAVWTLVLVKLLLPVTLPGPLSAIVSPRPVDSFSVTAESNSETAATGIRGGLNRLAVRPIPREATRDAAVADSTETIGTEVVLPAVPPVLGWQRFLFVLWGAVSLTLFGLFAREMLQVRRLVAAARPASEELIELLRQATAIVGTRAAIGIRISDELHSPALCGFWRGTILIPAALVQRLDREQLLLVLVHELTHWRRGDLQVNTLQSVLQIIYFYNPLLWLANGVIRRVREFAVDEETLAAIGGTVQQYAETLIDVADQSHRGPRLTWSIVGAVPSRGALAGRVTRMLSRPLPRQARLGWPRLAAVCGLAVLLLPMGRLAGRSIAAEPPRSVSPQGNAEDRPSLSIVPPALIPTLPPESLLPPGAAIDQEATEIMQRNLAGLAEEDRRAFDQPAADELSGIVIDLETMQPIAGATIREIYVERRSEATTNERGLFRLRTTEKSTVLLVTREGYGPEAAVRQPGIGEWMLGLSNRTALEGRVTNAAGQPVPKARVRAAWMWDMGQATVPLETETLSRADGTYRLPLPRFVRSEYGEFEGFDVQASAAGEGQARQTVPQIVSDQTVPVSFELQPGIRFEAKVVDSVTGEPVEGFGLYRPTKPFFAVRSNAEGKLVLLDRPPGQLEVMCGAGASIPPPAGCVDCEGFEGIEPGPYARWWSADAHELMQEERPAGETWQNNSDMLWFDLKPGMKPVTIVVERGVVITGRVTDPEGRPVPGATVAPALTGHGHSLSGDTRYSVITDREGKYRTSLPASKNARYNLMVHDGPHDEWRRWANGVSRVIQTAPGEVIEDFDLQLSRPGVVRGRVLKGGKPVLGRVVKLQSVDRMENTYYDPKVTTKEDGTFEFLFVRPGKHHLTATKFYSSNAEGALVVDVAAGAAVEGLEIEPHGGE